MIYQVYDVLNTVGFVILAYIFMHVFCFQRERKLVITLLGVFVWIVAEIAVSYCLNELFLAKAMLTIALLFVFGLLFFKDAFYKVLLLSFAYYGIMGILELIAYSLYNTLIGYVSLSEIDDKVNMILSGVTSHILFLITIIILKTILKKDKIKTVNAVGWIRLLAFPIISLLVIIAPVFLIDTALSEKECFFLLVMGMVILAFNFYMYYVLNVEAEYMLTKENMLKLRNHADELADLYDQISKQQDRLSSREHEHKNTMALISSYINDKNWDALSAYVNEEIVHVEEGRIIDIGNPVVSAIINAKYWEAVHECIQVSITADSISKSSIDDNTWLIILSNLFNNAIEACKKLEKDRFIKIKILNIGETTIIVFSNTFDGELKKKGEVFLSTKKDSDIHGYGIRNMIDTVHAIDGEIEFSDQNRWFEVRILLPN